MDKKFESLSTYIDLAKKTISKFGPKFYNGLSIEMLNSSDAVSDVATAMMYADWRFDPSRTGKDGQSKTLYSYRNQCAIWAIKTYVTNKYKKHTDNISLDFISKDTDNSMHSTLSDNRVSEPIEILIKQEQSENLSKNISELLSNPNLSEKQREQIRLYYLEKNTLSQIGKKFGVSREAVRQNIKRAIEIIKSYDKISV